MKKVFEENLPLNKCKVYVLALCQPLPTDQTSEIELSSWVQRNLDPLRNIRRCASLVYAGEEFTDDGFYHREWAILAVGGLSRIVTQFDPEIFTWRRVTKDEVFMAKYQDLLLQPMGISEFKLGELL